MTTHLYAGGGALCSTNICFGFGEKNRDTGGGMPEGSASLPFRTTNIYFPFGEKNRDTGGGAQHQFYEMSIIFSVHTFHFAGPIRSTNIYFPFGEKNRDAGGGMPEGSASLPFRSTNIYFPFGEKIGMPDTSRNIPFRRPEHIFFLLFFKTP